MQVIANLGVCHQTNGGPPCFSRDQHGNTAHALSGSESLNLQTRDEENDLTCSKYSELKPGLAFLIPTGNKRVRRDSKRGEKNSNRCWRRLPEWLRRRRSGTALSVAYDVAHTHANSWTQRSFSRSPKKCDRAWHSILYSVGACNSSRSGFSATPAHAASCPPLARERFMRGVARMPLGCTVNAARLWPYTKRSCIKRLDKHGK